jgi:hypothetical protein
MIIGKAAGIDAITIVRKGLWGHFIPPRFLDCGYCYLVFPELINPNTKASCSYKSWAAGIKICINIITKKLNFFYFSFGAKLFRIKKSAR